MVSFGQIISHPNFATEYQNNPFFRKAYQSYTQNPNMPLADLMMALKMDIDSSGAVKFIYGAIGSTPMSFADAQKAFNFNRTIKSTREYLSGSNMYSSGGQSSLAAEILQAQGITTRTVMHSLKDQNDLLSFMEKYKTKDDLNFYGLPIPDQEKVAVIEATNRRGQRLTSSQIARRLGMEGYMPKRLKVLTADRDLAWQNTFNVHLFDPEAYFKATDPTMEKQVEQIARVRKASGKYKTDGALQSIEDIRQGVYKQMSDGLSYMTQDAFDKRMNELESKARKLVSLGQKKRGNAILKVVREQRHKVSKGGSFNIRLISALDQDNNVLPHIKGDVVIIPNQRAKDIFGNDTADLYTSRFDVKHEQKISNVAMMTLEAHGLPTTARSNILTDATFQEMLDPNGYLGKSARNEMTQHIEDMKAGKLTPGLKRLFDEIKKVDFTELGSPAAARELIESQKFIRSLEGMVKAGIPINANDHITSQLFNAMSKHYTRSRKGKAGKTISFMGQETKYYEMSFPMEGSNSAHMVNIPVEDALSGTIGIDNMKMGRFRLNAKDIARAYDAFGGPDQDDRLYSVLRYDENTKRLLAFIFRDPNEAGEYMVFDADITYDKNIPKQVRALFEDSKKLKRKIPHMRKGAERQAKVAELNKINEILHQYFSGKSVDIGSSMGLNAGNKIAQVDLAQMMSEPLDGITSIFAPKGWTKNASAMKKYVSGSLQRGFGSWADGSAAVIKSARAELREEVSSSSGRLPFKYVGGGYSEYHSTYFKPMQEMAVAQQVTKPAGKASKTAARLEITKKATARIESELESSGILGRVVNAQSVLDEFLKSNLKGLSPELRKELSKVWRDQGFMHVDRESIVDAATKTNSVDIIKTAEAEITRNYERLGKVIAHMQSISGDINIGAEPILFQTRTMTDSEALAALKKGFGADTGFLLSDNDPKAYVANKLRQQIQDAEWLEEQKTILTDTVRGNLLDDLSEIELTPRQLTAASEFISSMQESSNQLSKLLDGSHEEVADLMGRFLGGEDVFNVDDLNTAGIRKLYEQGFLRGISDDQGIKSLVPTGELDDHMLAVARILAENKKSLRMISPMAEDGGESLFNLYTGAMQRRVYGPRILKKIDELDTLEGISEFVSGNVKKGHAFTELADKAWDPVERNVKLINKLISIQNTREYSAATRREAFGIGNFLLRDLTRTGQVDPNEMVRFNDSVRQVLDPSRPLGERATVSGLRYTPRQPINDAPPGLRRLINRESVDAVSDTVSHVPRERMTRLDSAFIKNAMNDPIIKKGMIGLGIFAGIGVLHRLTKDPTPEDAGGPPLLPGGNPYESYDAAGVQDMSSIYPSLNNFGSGGGMMYTVRTNGSYDPNQVSGQIASITGGNVRSTIYNTREINRPRQSSQQILNGMIGR